MYRALGSDTAPYMLVLWILLVFGQMQSYQNTSAKIFMRLNDILMKIGQNTLIIDSKILIKWFRQTQLIYELRNSMTQLFNGFRHSHIRHWKRSICFPA